MNIVDMVRESVRDIAKHPVLELDYADHGIDDEAGGHAPAAEPANDFHPLGRQPDFFLAFA